MVVGGLPEPRPDHCEASIAFAVDVMAAVRDYRAWNGEPLSLRIGVNSGPVVAGVIGRKKFIYDRWGDTVNTASRMESNGLVNAIQVTQAVRDRLESGPDAGRYLFEERGPVLIKGKGEMLTYILKPRLSPEPA
jgi:class 3 adenylate cyclase